MDAKHAVAARILELCAQRSMTVNALADLSGIPPTTLYSILGSKSRNPGVVSLQKLCDGLGISLRTFFDSPLFEGLEPEVR